MYEDDLLRRFPPFPPFPPPRDRPCLLGDREAERLLLLEDDEYDRRLGGRAFSCC